MVELYLFGAAVLVLGVLWFHVIAPMLEGFGLLPGAESVKPDAPAPAEVTSSGREQQNAFAPSAAQTDSPPASDRQPAPAITREQMLDAAKVLRAAGLSREGGRAVFAALGLPLDNNLWAQAAPPEPAEDYATPIAGRPTRREFYQDEPALAYTPPPQK